MHVTDDTIRYEVKLNVPARVPLRIEFGSLEFFRGTDAQGQLSGELTRPLNPGRWSVKVTELLSGKTSAVEIPSAEPGSVPRQRVALRPNAEVTRAQELRVLLQRAQGRLKLISANLSPESVDTLRAAFRRRGIETTVTNAPPREPTPGIYLAAATTQNLGPLLQPARTMGLMDFPISAELPGAGRGFIGPLFAPRGYEEHVIALIGGDSAGLNEGVTALVRWLDTSARSIPDARTPAAVVRNTREVRLTASGVEPVPLPRLQELTGVKLTGLRVAGDHLLVTADGYHRNVAWVKDTRMGANVLRTARVGHAPTVGSASLGSDGAWFAVSARVTNRVGQVLCLFGQGDSEPALFGGFGDLGIFTHQFAVSDDGRTVLAPGTHGVICWRRDGEDWREAWAIDYWREFERLDWPVANDAQRTPQFHASLPRGADHALILFGEFTNNGWITDQQFCTAWLAAVDLASGRERWRFNVPLPRTVLFPTLRVSPRGHRQVLQVQTGTWGEKRYYFFVMDQGTATGQWVSPLAPRAVAVADSTGNTALVYEQRLVEVRRPDGTLQFNQLWPTQPVSVAFAADEAGIYVADDAGRLSLVNGEGQKVWEVDAGSRNVVLASEGERVYGAGWDGRLRAWTSRGELRWVLDVTPHLKLEGMNAMVAAAVPADRVRVANRKATASSEVPAGSNLLRTGRASLRVGGTQGWKSSGTVQVIPPQLVNGQTNDVTTPWLSVNEVFWTSVGGRQVYAEVIFPQPTKVTSMTVYEHPDYPDSWPRMAVVQVWDDEAQLWKTARAGVFLNGPVNTYRLDLPAVTKLRYVPLHSYFDNFYTCEIEVR